jgi:hypothetical protein
MRDLADRFEREMAVPPRREGSAICTKTFAAILAGLPI